MADLAPDDPRHGTYNGYSNLRCRCQSCRAANAAAQLAYRRSKGIEPRQPPACGTCAAYHRHRRRDEEPCVSCVGAYREYRTARYRELGHLPMAEFVLSRRPACGTFGGYRLHLRNTEEPCGECREAARAEWTARARRRRDRDRLVPSSQRLEIQVSRLPPGPYTRGMSPSTLARFRKAVTLPPNSSDDEHDGTDDA